MKIIDLSQKISNGMVVYPGDPLVKIEQVHTHDKEGWALKKIEMGLHTGSHVDAFSHMDESGQTIDQMSLAQFCGPAQYLSITNELPREMGLIFQDKLDEGDFEKISVALPPFVAGEMTVGLEKKLLHAGIVTYTDLVNLEQLPVNEVFTFYGLPLKIEDGDGSPVRAIAILP